MSKIKNGGLDQYGAKPFKRQQFGTGGVEGVNNHYICLHGHRGKLPLQVPLSMYLGNAQSEVHNIVQNHGNLCHRKLGVFTNNSRNYEYHPTTITNCFHMLGFCHAAQFLITLENMAINDAVPLEAAQRNVIAKFKSFRASQHQQRYWPDSLTSTKLA